MEKRHLQHHETLVLETLLSALDARESARGARAPMLTYLCDLVVARAREELSEVRGKIERIGQDAS